MIVLAVDPGTTKSAWLVYDTEEELPLAFGHDDNSVVLGEMRLGWRHPGATTPDVVVIEKVESFGMAVGAEVFETVFWTGRFTEAIYPVRVERIGRRLVKTTLCGSAKAKDSNIRQALIDRYGGPEAIGRKATPGPLFGVSGDVWSALAVAVTWTETHAGPMPA